MNPTQFAKWLAEMRAANLIRFDRDAADMLDVSPNWLASEYKKKGGGIQLALACRALLHRLEPYS